MMPTSQSKDYLWLQISELPYFRGLLRAVEARFYENIELPDPTLDLGCGDGHFASLAFDRRLEAGTDPWWAPLHEACKRRTYQELIQSDGAAQPFPDSYFASAVSNSVLEHIPHIDDVLLETARLLQPGAPFIFCVPNHQFLSTLSIGRGFDKIGLQAVGDAYRRFFNRISRHHHCDDPETWEKRLQNAGFTLERWWHYFSPAALRVLEWGHYLGLPSLISKKLTNHWILVPKPWNLALTRRKIEPYFSEPLATEKGVYTFFIARRD
jgi:ubiquinone/menaquinone biosynthesis C-methylase UbiE